MASRCGADLKAFIPWWARPGRRLKAEEAGGGGAPLFAPLFQTEGGRRGRGGLSGLNRPAGRLG
jgi:hypothetical protein